MAVKNIMVFEPNNGTLEVMIDQITSLKDLGEKAKYKVIFSETSFKEALRFISKRKADVDLALVGGAFSGEGIDLVRAINIFYPNVPVVLVSGASEDVLNKNHGLSGLKYTFLKKPSNMGELCEVLERASAKAAAKDRKIGAKTALCGLALN